MIVSLWWAYFPFVQSTCSITCSAAMRSLQQDRWQFAHYQLYPQQQSTDPDQVLFLPTCPSTVLLQFKVQQIHAFFAARPLAVCAPPALSPATINRPRSCAFLANLSLYGSTAVMEGSWLLLLVHFLAQPAQCRQQC